MTIQSAIRYAREFVDGVRTIPSCARILADRANVRSRGFEDGQEFAEASRSHELEAERAAHKETRRLLDEATALLEEHQLARLEQITALETIDALTVWHSQNEVQIPHCCIELVSLDESFEHIWRHTPKSWAEFRKTKEGGSDG
jgi:hypothetical protein